MEKQQIKQIFRVVCVVENLSETLENWKRMVRFDLGSIKMGKSDESDKHIYQGKEASCSYEYADFDLGGVEIRLVEPKHKKGGDPYSDALAKKGQGFHHLSVCVEDREALIKKYEELGIEPISKEESKNGDVYMIYDFEQDAGLSISLCDKMTGPCAREEI
ncbi:MAG: VOC family protein [Anaerovoracaceae bacterium]